MRLTRTGQPAPMVQVALAANGGSPGHIGVSAASVGLMSHRAWASVMASIGKEMNRILGRNG